MALLYNPMEYRDHTVKPANHIDQALPNKTNRDTDVIPNITKKALGDLKYALQADTILAKMGITVGSVMTAATIGMAIAGIFVPAVGGVVLIVMGTVMALGTAGATMPVIWHYNKIQSVFSKIAEVQKNSDEILEKKRVTLANNNDVAIKSIINEVHDTFGTPYTIGFFRDLDESTQRKHLEDYPDLAKDLATWCYAHTNRSQEINNQTRSLLDLLYETKENYTPECRDIILQARLPRFLSKFRNEITSEFTNYMIHQYGSLKPEDKQVFDHFILKNLDVTAENIDALKRVAEKFRMKELQQDLEDLEVFQDAVE